MTDQTVDRHEERIIRENRRQALNHAVRLSTGLDPDSTIEAATRFARFLDGDGQTEAVPTEPESVQQREPLPDDLLNILVADDTRDMSLTIEGERVSDATANYIRCILDSLAAARLQIAKLRADHPPVPVTEQHGATERPIRALVNVNRNGGVALYVEGPNGEPANSATFSVMAHVPADQVTSTADVVAFLANAINGTDR